MKLAGWVASAVGIAATLAVAASQRARAPSTPSPPPKTADVGALPSGPAVLVANGYQAPKDNVDSTGAYVPANGKPTLVWVDAIW
ncbi:MAG: hypothetical protein EXR66_07465 [Dehalococcoidia bacterium]|nr:hypothetical protein [Dehalococcoidia bacterium]